MKIVAVEKIDNCFEDEFVFKYVFNGIWTKEVINSVTGLGKPLYYDSFPRPMFQFNCPDGTVIKGLQETDECRVIFPRGKPDEAKIGFEEVFKEGS